MFEVRRLIHVTWMLCIIMLVFQPTSIHGQASQRQLKSQGDAYFKNKNYRQALNHYVRYNQYDSSDEEVIKRMAICQFHSNQVDKAESNLESLWSQKKLVDDEEVTYYLGEIYRHQFQFLKAANFYKKSLSQTKSSSIRKDIILKLKNCEAGLDVIHLPQVGFIENMGPLVNSIEDDKMPLYSHNHPDKLYFASNFDRDEANPLNAKKSFDIYSTVLDDGNWLNPTLFPKKFSSDRDEFPLDFFNHGNVMYFQRGSVGGARILIDTFSILEDTLAPSKFYEIEAPVFPELGDRNIHNYADSIIIFSSLRPGGFGGLDLYYSIKSKIGWTKPVNLGPEINSSFNETDAFLTDNGAVLYFSSDRPQSIGGYDIFYSRFNATTKTWGTIKNAGLPLNSAADDMGIQMASNGMSIIFSSDRKTGYGGHDLYIIYPENPIGDMAILRGQAVPGFLLLMDDNEVGVMEERIELIDDDENTSATKMVEENSIVRDQIDDNIYPKTKINIAPIYFSASDVVLNTQSIKELDKIAAYIAKYPNLTLNILSHSSGYEGPTHFDLYFSARRAEQVVNYLIERGVNEKSMTILGVGRQYPYAKRLINGEVAGFATKLNRRIELRVEGGNEYHLKFEYQDGGLGRDYVDDKNKLLDQLLNGISFKVQVKIATQVYKDEILDRYDHAMVEKRADNDKYIYSVGWSKEFAEIRELSEKIKNEDFDQSQVIAYYKGGRISNSEAQGLSEFYPELKTYLKFK